MFLHDILSLFLWIVYEHRGYAYETAAQVVTIAFSNVYADEATR